MATHPYDQLAELPSDKCPVPHLDRSIVVPAMSEYARFTGKQIAMPTIWFDRHREYLRDGAQLLQALRLAGCADKVVCLWLSESKLAMPSGVRLSVLYGGSGPAPMHDYSPSTRRRMPRNKTCALGGGDRRRK